MIQSHPRRETANGDHRPPGATCSASQSSANCRRLARLLSLGPKPPFVRNCLTEPTSPRPRHAVRKSPRAIHFRPLFQNRGGPSSLASRSVACPGPHALVEENVAYVNMRTRRGSRRPYRQHRHRRGRLRRRETQSMSGRTPYGATLGRVFGHTTETRQNRISLGLYGASRSRCLASQLSASRANAKNASQPLLTGLILSQKGRHWRHRTA
jgi:hypothetical protein